MENLKEMSIEQLQTLKSEIENELASRQQTSKPKTTYYLSYKKALNPCSYRQVEFLRSFANVSIRIKSNSQLMKRLEMSEASVLIDLAQAGEEILITDEE